MTQPTMYMVPQQQQLMQPVVQQQLLPHQQQQQQQQQQQLGQPSLPELAPSGKKMVKISSSTTTVAKIPKCHLVEAIHILSERIDPTLTAKCAADELVIIIWCLTNMEPFFGLAALSCEFYSELYTRIKTSADRVRDRGKQIWSYGIVWF